MLRQDECVMGIECPRIGQPNGALQPEKPAKALMLVSQSSKRFRFISNFMKAWCRFKGLLALMHADVLIASSIDESVRTNTCEEGPPMPLRRLISQVRRGHEIVGT